MGRQVNFLFTPDDLVESIKRVEYCGPVVLFRAISYDNRLEIISDEQRKSLQDLEYGIYMTRPEYLDRVKLHYVPQQEYFLVETDTSEAIELSSGRYDAGVLRRGRMYYTPSYYNHDCTALTDKSPEFVKWAQWVLRASVKGLNRDPVFGFYIGPYAEQLYKEGKIELSQM